MKMRKQRYIGLALIALSAALILLVSAGSTPEERDATAVLLTLPLGVYMIFTPHYILRDCDPAAEQQRHERSLTQWQERE